MRSFKKDEVLFKFGDDGDYFYIILSGQIDLYLPNPLVKKLNQEINSIERYKTRLQI